MCSVEKPRPRRRPDREVASIIDIKDRSRAEAHDQVFLGTTHDNFTFEDVQLERGRDDSMSELDFGVNLYANVDCARASEVSVDAAQR